MSSDLLPLQGALWPSKSFTLILTIILSSHLLIITPTNGNQASSSTAPSSSSNRSTNSTNPTGNDTVAIDAGATATPTPTPTASPVPPQSESPMNPLLNKLNRIFDGTRVGPFYLFRSSRRNAEIVKDAFKHHPILRTLGLAFGDEFPHLRDDLVRQHQTPTKTKTPPPIATTFEKTVSALAKADNWRYDMHNDQVEMEQPFYRHQRGSWINSLLGRFGGNRFGTYNPGSWRSGTGTGGGGATVTVRA